MEKPTKIKEKSARDYIDHLETRLHRYDIQPTLAKSYIAVKNQMDQVSELLIQLKITLDTLSDKDDKLFDRITKFTDKLKTNAETLVYLRENIDPDTIKKVEQEDGSIYEELFNSTKKDAGS